MDEFAKVREEKIRDAALILAGQCIALFLYNLSQSQEARLFSNEQNSRLVVSRNPKAWFKKKTNINSWECFGYSNSTICSHNH